MRDRFGKPTQLGTVIVNLLDEALCRNTPSRKCRYDLLRLEKLKEYEEVKSQLKTQLQSRTELLSSYKGGKCFASVRHQRNPLEFRQQQREPIVRSARQGKSSSQQWTQTRLMLLPAEPCCKAGSSSRQSGRQASCRLWWQGFPYHQRN